MSREVARLWRKCFYCEQEDLPSERFTRYPCCGYEICVNCRRKNRDVCLECLTRLPPGGERVAGRYLGILRDPMYKHGQPFADHLMGVLFMYGIGTFVDEIDCLPTYAPIERAPTIMAVLNPSSPEIGIEYLLKAANRGYTPAMLNLADVYRNQGDLRRAEDWYRSATCRNYNNTLGQQQGSTTVVHPIALTRYGCFLHEERANFRQAKIQFYVAAELGHTEGQYRYARYLLEGTGRSWMWHLNPNEQDEKRQAIKYLCQAAEHGHVEAVVLLAQTLLDQAREQYQSLHVVGFSPLPRVIKMLRLHDTDVTPQKCRQRIQEILDKQCKANKRCAACGEPSRRTKFVCVQCKAVHYCSKDCQRKDFRDGHKFDCCSDDKLYDDDAMFRIFPKRVYLPFFAETPRALFVFTLVVLSIGFWLLSLPLTIARKSEL